MYVSELPKQLPGMTIPDTEYLLKPFLTAQRGVLFCLVSCDKRSAGMRAACRVNGAGTHQRQCALPDWAGAGIRPATLLAQGVPCPLALRNCFSSNWSVKQGWTLLSQPLPKDLVMFSLVLSIYGGPWGHLMALLVVTKSSSPSETFVSDLVWLCDSALK